MHINILIKLDQLILIHCKDELFINSQTLKLNYIYIKKLWIYCNTFSERIRPKSFNNFIGQNHLIGDDGPKKALIMVLFHL